MRSDVGFYVPSVAPLLDIAGEATTGGAETQILLIARALSARGVRVSLVAYETEGSELVEPGEGVTVVSRVPHLGGRGRVAAIREAVATFASVARLDARVVVTRVAGPHVGLAAVAAKLKGRRFVYSSASLTDFAFERRRPSLRDRVLHRVGLTLADEIVVQTEEQARLCRLRLRRPATVIPNISETGDDTDRRPDAFLWAGRTAWYKRPLLYVELARALPEAKFWMIASPAAKHEDVSADVERAAAAVPNLELINPRPRPDLLALLQRAVAVVNTSEFEGMPNVTLEGWSQGVPALTFSHDPDGLIEGHALGIHAAGSWSRFVEGARHLWESRDAQHAFTRRCLAYVNENHDAGEIAAQWLRVLRLQSDVARDVQRAQRQIEAA